MLHAASACFLCSSWACVGIRKLKMEVLNKDQLQCTPEVAGTMNKITDCICHLPTQNRALAAFV